MISESGGRAVVIAPSALGSKDLPAGLSKVPPRRIRQTIYPPWSIRRRSVKEKDPWRVSRHDNLPSSTSMASRNEVWKTEGISTFSPGVLVRGHGIHNHRFYFPAQLVRGFTLSLVLWTSSGHRCRPFSPLGTCLHFYRAFR